MPEHFSLARQRWIPVALEDGQRAFVRPCEISEPYEGKAILRIATGRPDCDVSLTEVLIGLLAASVGPSGEREWADLYLKPPSKAELEAALLRFEPALRLDGDGCRFFQDRETLEGATTPVEALFMDAPAEHFVKPGRISVLSRTGAAIALLTLQTSAPAGGAGHRTSLRGGGPLSTLAVPGTANDREPTLWQRLWANVPDDMKTEDGRTLSRVFPWLGNTRTSDLKNGGVSTAPEDVDPAQCFFGMPRRIRLVFEPNTNGRACDLTGQVDDTVVTGYITRPWGTNYVSWSRGHPLSPYYKPKPTDTEYLPLHLQSSHVGYRDWLGMVVANHRTVPAACIETFRRRAREIAEHEPNAGRRSRLLVAGYAMDNMKPLDFGEAMLPLLVARTDKADDAIKDLTRAWVQAADGVSSQLVTAVRVALYGPKGKADRDSATLGPVRARFWTETEPEFFRHLRAAADEIEAKADELSDHLLDVQSAAGGRWLRTLTRHALGIFDETVPLDDAESDRIRDVIDGRKLLVLTLKGYGAAGKALFHQLHQTVPETKGKNGGKGK